MPVKPQMPLLREWVGWIMGLLGALDFLTTMGSQTSSATAKQGGAFIDGLLIVGGILLVLSGRKKRGK